MICGTEVRFDRVQVRQQAREEAEERLRLESGALLFVRVGQDQDDDRKDFGHVVHFCLVVVDTGRVGVILDHKDDQLGERVDRLENSSRRRTSLSLVLDVALDAGLCAHTEEHGRDLFALEDTLRLKLKNEIDEGLLDRIRLLVKSNPFGKAKRELLSNTSSIARSLAGRCGTRDRIASNLLEQMAGSVIDQSAQLF